MERKIYQRAAPSNVEGPVLYTGPPRRKSSPTGTIAYVGAVGALGFFAVNAIATAVLCVGGIAALTILTGRNRNG